MNSNTKAHLSIQASCVLQTPTLSMALITLPLQAILMTFQHLQLSAFFKKTPHLSAFLNCWYHFWDTLCPQ